MITRRRGVPAFPIAAGRRTPPHATLAAATTGPGGAGGLAAHGSLPAACRWTARGHEAATHYVLLQDRWPPGSAGTTMKRTARYR